LVTGHSEKEVAGLFYGGGGLLLVLGIIALVLGYTLIGAEPRPIEAPADDNVWRAVDGTEFDTAALAARCIALLEEQI